jgi:rhodanese-related sulfurtransferase
MNPGIPFESFESKTANPNYEDVFDIEPLELQKKMAKVKLIDVRQADEFVDDLGHIANAELIVLDTLPDKLSSIPKDQTVVFVCRSGGRSARATSFALMNGYSHVYNLKGGMILWNQLALPTQK